MEGVHVIVSFDARIEITEGARVETRSEINLHTKSIYIYQTLKTSEKNNSDDRFFTQLLFRN